MTRLIRTTALAFLAIMAAPLCLAAPSDARDWANLAGDLRNMARDIQANADANPALDAQLPAPLRMGLQRFGVASSQLSTEMKTYDGAKDLVCIFRGMSEETGKQLTSLNDARTGADQSDALTRLVMMLDDATQVGEAAARVMETADRIEPVDGGLTGKCEAVPFR